jgi:hypothetical protein
MASSPKYVTLAERDENNKIIQNRTFCLRVVLAIFTIIVVVAVAVVAIVGIYNSSNANAVQRYCVAGNDVFGSITTDVNDRTIAWDIQYTPALGVLTSLHIEGPTPVGVSEGDLNFALCGAPSTVACDVTSEPNRVKDTIKELSPGGSSLKPKIQAIRKEPWRYRLKINRGVGAPVVFSLASVCGTE